MPFVFVLIARLVVWLRPALPIICALMAWTITAMLALNVMAVVRQGVASARKMHRIPCSNCLYASESYRLKCSVRPSDAFSEQAIGCQDFAAEDQPSAALSTL